MNYYNGYGEIFNFRISNETERPVTDLKKLMSLVTHVKEKEYRYFIRLYVEIDNRGQSFLMFLSELFMLLFDEPFNGEYSRLVLEEKRNAAKAYSMAFYNLYDVKTIMKKFIFRIDQLEFEEICKALLHRIEVGIDLMLYRVRLSEIKKDFILRSQRFDPIFFDKVLPNCKGFIFSEGEEELIQMYTREFGVPIIVTDTKYEDGLVVALDGQKNKVYVEPTQEKIDFLKRIDLKHTYMIGDKPSYKEGKVKLFSPLVHDRDIDKIVYSDWFDGVGPIKSEFLFTTKNRIPSKEEQTMFYTKIFTKSLNKEIIVCIPDFSPEKPNAIMKDQYTDLESLAKHNEIFLVNLIAMAEAAKSINKQINVVVPMIRINEELTVWKDYIITTFESCGAITPKVGICFETESAFEYFEDYKIMDFAIIGLNGLIEELSDDLDRFSDISKTELVELLWPQMRDLHQYLRSYKINVRHIVSGDCLANPHVLKKFLSTGFYEFAIPVTHIKLVEEAIAEYIDSRGAYVGYAAERLELKKAKKEKEIEKDKEYLLLKVSKLIEKNKNRVLKEDLEKEENEKKALKPILPDDDDDEDE
ncbi:MAG: putative PEP-binding protein [Acholeplasmataceae bacterium]|jgi:phosphoenolpyruvate-protein kinase (PTS system EI component)|nr:putative PEP-binding protein [Acholeplasmataceae bacterium]